jgi:hypothetical protein
MLVVLVCVVAVLADHGSDQNGGSQSGGSAGSVAAPAMPGGGIDAPRGTVANGGVPDAGSAAGPAASAPAGSGEARPTDVQPRIVWTGSMSVEVPAGTVDATIRKISATAGGLGGYLQASQVDGTPDPSDGIPQTATITMRVPAASFGALRDAVGGYGTVRSSSTSSQDVTADYVDLKARETALTTSRATYLTLFAKATTVSDILAVQRQLDGVQTQIEQIEGQLRVLAGQSDLATLTINLAEQGARQPGQENGFLHALRTAWRSFVHGLEDIVAALGAIALTLLVLAVLYLLYRLPRWLRRRPETHSAGPSPVESERASADADDHASVGAGEAGAGEQTPG